MGARGDDDHLPHSVDSEKAGVVTGGTSAVGRQGGDGDDRCLLRLVTKRAEGLQPVLSRFESK